MSNSERAAGTKLTLLFGGLLGGFLLLNVLVFLGSLLILRFMWAWVIPDLFPGAVEQGLIAGHVGWWTATKLSLVIALVLWGVRGAADGRD